MPLELGPLLRLKAMTDEAASSLEPESASAPAFTEAYNRLRAAVRELVDKTPIEGEFLNFFPEIEQVSVSLSQHPREAVREMVRFESAAKQARLLLGQLAGWVDGLIQEQTLERRLRLEAEERVKQERKQAPGFRPE
jgi:hypothetical protein